MTARAASDFRNLSSAVAALAGYLKSDAAKAVIKSYGYDL